MSELEERLAAVVRDACRDAVAAALEDAELGSAPAGGDPDAWRSRLWSVEADTRLGLADVAEALGVSERTVRRYLDGNGERSALPHRRGPTGISVRAGDLRTWIEDVEGANRFRDRRVS